MNCAGYEPTGASSTNPGTNFAATGSRGTSQTPQSISTIVFSSTGSPGISCIDHHVAGCNEFSRIGTRTVAFHPFAPGHTGAPPSARERTSTAGGRRRPERLRRADLVDGDAVHRADVLVARVDELAELRELRHRPVLRAPEGRGRGVEDVARARGRGGLPSSARTRPESGRSSPRHRRAGRPSHRSGTRSRGTGSRVDGPRPSRSPACAPTRRSCRWRRCACRGTRSPSRTSGGHPTASPRTRAARRSRPRPQRTRSSLSRGRGCGR